MVTIIQKIWPIQHQSMFSASGSVARKVYKKIEKGSNVWLIPHDAEPGAGVHFDTPGDKNSDGYAGRTITFDLDDGTTYEAKGPWHSNSDALFQATGYDVRDQHLTQVVIALKRSDDSHDTLEDIVYFEKEAQLGAFDRGNGIGTEWANKLGRPVILFRQSTGGSCCGSHYPSDWTNEQISEYWKSI